MNYWYYLALSYFEYNDDSVHLKTQRRRKNMAMLSVQETGGTKQCSKRDYCSQLPTEILEKILIYSESYQLAAIRLVSKRLRDVISQSDYLWQVKCKKEFGESARLAKETSSPMLSWFQIYRNLKLWPKMMKNPKRFYAIFTLPSHLKEVLTADLNQGILVVNGCDYTKLLDLNRLNYKPVIINGKQKCERIVSNRNITTLLLKHSAESKDNILYVQRTVESKRLSKEAMFHNIKIFQLTEIELYYISKTATDHIVYKVDLKAETMEEQVCFSVDSEIKEMIVKYGKTVSGVKYTEVILFTPLGNIIIYRDNKFHGTRCMSCWSWAHCQNNHSVIDENNFIFYKEKKIGFNVPAKYSVCYEFPHIQLAILYNNMVIVATKENKILLFQISNYYVEINVNSFEQMGQLPKKAVIQKICVCETGLGPVVMVTTHTQIYLYKSIIFPTDKERSPFDDENLYERLISLRDRLESLAKSELTKTRSARKRKLTT